MLTNIKYTPSPVKDKSLAVVAVGSGSSSDNINWTVLLPENLNRKFLRFDLVGDAAIRFTLVDGGGTQELNLMSGVHDLPFCNAIDIKLSADKENGVDTVSYEFIEAE
jgi:hypothetical protein